MLSTFAPAPYVGSSSQNDILALEADEFGHSEPRLDPQQQQPAMLRNVYVPLLTSVARERAQPGEDREAMARHQDQAPTRVLDLLDERSLYLAGDAGTLITTSAKRAEYWD